MKADFKPRLYFEKLKSPSEQLTTEQQWFCNQVNASQLLKTILYQRSCMIHVM
jgi:hypothetical protein